MQTAAREIILPQIMLPLISQRKTEFIPLPDLRKCNQRNKFRSTLILESLQRAHWPERKAREQTT